MQTYDHVSWFVIGTFLQGGEERRQKYKFQTSAQVRHALEVALTTILSQLLVYHSARQTSLYYV